MNITFRQLVESYQNKTLNEVDGRFAVDGVADDPDLSFDTIEAKLKEHEHSVSTGKPVALGEFYSLISHRNSLTHEHKKRLVKIMAANNKILARTPNTRESQYNMAGEREERALMGNDYNTSQAVLK